MSSKKKNRNRRNSGRRAGQRIRSRRRFALAAFFLPAVFLLIAYILTGDDQKRNSLLWCGLFIFSVGYSVYEIAKFLSVKDLVYLIHYLAFYLVGYSPDKWYERKTIPQNTQA